jgi:hypothetical protein
LPVSAALEPGPVGSPAPGEPSESGVSPEAGGEGATDGPVVAVGEVVGTEVDSVGGVVVGLSLGLGLGDALDAGAEVGDGLDSVGEGDGDVVDGSTSDCGVPLITESVPVLAVSPAPEPPTNWLGPELGSPTRAGGRDGATSMLPN